MCVEATLCRVVQQRTPSKRRVVFNRLNQSLGYRSGIQAEELGELPHSFAARQPDHKSTWFLRHSLESDPIHTHKDVSDSQKLFSNSLPVKSALQPKIVA